MDTTNNLSQKINEQIEKLNYLEGKRETNIQIINNRVREITEEKQKRENSKSISYK